LCSKQQMLKLQICNNEISSSCWNQKAVGKTEVLTVW
jgi:hypothetical protein